MKRRKFLKIFSAAMLGTAVVPAYASLVEPSLFDVVEQGLHLRRLGPGVEGMRAVQISDIHIGSWFPRGRLESVIQKVIDLSPEVVFITGDYLTVHGDHPKMRSLLYDPLRELAQHAAVFSVMGNHDLYEGFGGELQKMLQDAGIADVTNRYVSYQRGGDTLYIAGAGTLSTGNWDLVELSKSVPRESAVVLLAHEPDTAQWSYEFGHYILQLSGHSHGGQIILPRSGPAILPWMGKMYPSGLYEIGSMMLYTNRGLGMTRVPFRFNCPPEISVFQFLQERA